MTGALDFPDPARLVSLTVRDAGSPYYVVAPAYTRLSAGTRVLHLLCHWLNRLGRNAYMLTFSRKDDLRINPALLTPELSPSVARHHREVGRTPIVIYPEVIKGNPLRADLVVRYVLNFPGLLGGDENYAPGEMVFGYSELLAQVASVPGQALHLPAVDAAVFTDQPTVPRAGACHYARKLREKHGAEPFGLPPRCVEILSREDGPQPEEIAALFRRSELFYVFENTALILEACLCGCPVVMMPNPWLGEPIADAEYGRNGIAWGNHPAEVARARETVGNMRNRFLAAIPAFFTQLERFVQATQARAAVTPYGTELDFRSLGFVSMHEFAGAPGLSISGLHERAAETEARLAEVLGSTSWHLTAPLRAVGTWLRRP
ncbi:MAG: hypothetical protein JOZ58_07080 [Acetobacteraceae bacterium]|nr:hypothetical protein [Acetobacteraceae bacterium]